MKIKKTMNVLVTKKSSEQIPAEEKEAILIQDKIDTEVKALSPQKVIF